MCQFFIISVWILVQWTSWVLFAKSVNINSSILPLFELLKNFSLCHIDPIECQVDCNRKSTPINRQQWQKDFIEDILLLANLYNFLFLCPHQNV